METEKSNVCYVRSVLKRLVCCEMSGHVDDLSDATDTLQKVLCVCSNLRRLLDDDEQALWEQALWEESIKEIEADMKDLESE